MVNNRMFISPIFLFSLILLSSFSFSSFLWTTSVTISQQNENAITSRPIIVGSNIIVATQGGYVYSLSPLTGSIIWTREIGGYPTQPAAWDNLIIVGSSNGNITALNRDGSEKWALNLDNATVYGIAVSEKAYATTSRGIYAIGKSGSAELIYNISSTRYTAPAANENHIVFGNGKNLVEISKSGKEIWNREIAEFWKSNPVIDGDIIFIGALDGGMYALQESDGSRVWKYQTNGWVMSTAHADGSSVYFGSNDGGIYSVGIFDGKLKWKYTTGGAVESTPEVAMLGGERAILAGSNDGKIYAIRDENGELLFEGSAKGWANSPIVLGKSIIFGAHDGSIYSLSAERACMINFPAQDSKVSVRELEIGGKVYSEYESPDVSVRFNGGGWQKAEAANGSWSYTVDPAMFELGIVRIECRASDPGGEESEPFTTISIVRADGQASEAIEVKAPQSAKEGGEFEIGASDSSGNPLSSFEVEFQGSTFAGSEGKAIVKASTGGENQKITVRKTGFDDGVAYITVGNPISLETIFLAIAAVFAIIAFIYYKRIMRK